MYFSFTSGAYSRGQFWYVSGGGSGGKNIATLEKVLICRQ